MPIRCMLRSLERDYAMEQVTKIFGAKKPRRGGRWKQLLILLAVILLIPALQVAIVRFVNPPRTLPMLLEQSGSVFSRKSHAPLRYQWIDLDQIPEMFLKHLWISEDQRFFQHDGFDWKEIDLAMDKAERTGKPVRGASTITNQCARSIFLWQGRSWIRKGLESYYTIWMEMLLPKRRILELYANVIEMGRGIYGVESRRAALLRSQCARADADAIGPAGGSVAESETLEPGAPG